MVKIKSSNDFQKENTNLAKARLETIKIRHIMTKTININKVYTAIYSKYKKFSDFVKKYKDRWFREWQYYNKYCWYLPFKRLFIKVWWFPLMYIHHYNLRDCKNYMPDAVNPKHPKGYGTKLRPFLGYISKIEEGLAPTWNWWQYLEKYDES